MFQFDKLNRNLGSVDKVPWIAEFMPTKWTYEALMVTQFKDNEYDRLVYDMNKTISVSDYNTIYRLPELEKALNTTVLNYRRNKLSQEDQSRLPLLKKEILKLSQNESLSEFIEMDELNYEYDYFRQTGKPTDAIFGWVDEGLYMEDDFSNGELNSNLPVPTFGDVQPGDIRYKDLNEDGIIDNNDREVIGFYHPNLQYGLNLRIAYKIFDLFLLGTGQTGRSTVYNNSYYWVYGERKYPELVTGRWTPATAATATYPRLSSTNNANNFRYSTYWLRKNDWFTLHTVQLNINLPERLAERSFAKRFQFYLRAYNLFTISANSKRRELNIGTEPQFRTYAAGINATF